MTLQNNTKEHFANEFNALLSEGRKTQIKKSGRYLNLSKDSEVKRGISSDACFICTGFGCF